MGSGRKLALSKCLQLIHELRLDMMIKKNNIFCDNEDFPANKQFSFKRHFVQRDKNFV